MKKVLSRLQLNDRIDGRVEEILDIDQLIISIEGDLLRVQNETRRPLKVGEVVNLIVASTSPLLFRLAPPRRSARVNGHLDITT